MSGHLQKLVQLHFSPSELSECRIRGLEVLCVNPEALQTSIHEWQRAAGCCFNAQVLAIGPLKSSKSMDWFPDVTTQVKRGDFIYISCKDTATVGRIRGTTHAYRLATYLADGDEQLIKDVELACTMLDALPSVLSGEHGSVVGSADFRTDDAKGALNFRNTSGGLTLAGIKCPNRVKWFPGPQEVIQAGEQLIVVSSILMNGVPIAGQKLELKGELQRRIFDVSAFNSLGGTLPPAADEILRLPQQVPKWSLEEQLSSLRVALEFGALVRSEDRPEVPDPNREQFD